MSVSDARIGFAFTISLFQLSTWTTRSRSSQNSETQRILAFSHSHTSLMSSSLSSAGDSPPIRRISQILTGETSRRHRREREISDILPLELWFEILVRLPVRTLLTLKCVSKSFLSLIQNPNFTYLHLSRFNNEFSDSNPSTSQLLLLEWPNCGFDVKNFVICPRNLIHMLTPNGDYNEVLAFGDFDCNVIGYLNGLLLMHRRDFTPTLKDTLTLWNPSIRKSLMIPLPQDYELGFNQPRLGFGYDSVSDDYKIVCILYKNTRAFVKVYDLRIGSWRSISVDVIDASWYLNDNVSVFVNGAIHWIAVELDMDDNPDTLRLSHIVSFDLGSELFSYTMLPDVDGVERVKVPLVFDGSLAVLSFSTGSICLWVIREDGWTKEYVAESLSYSVRQMLGWVDEVSSSTFSEKVYELLIVTPGGLISIDTKTQKVRSYNIWATYVATYTESLLWRELLPPLDVVERNEE